MSTENAAAGGELDSAPVVSAPNLDGGESLSVEQAFEAYQKRNTPAESAEADKPATAETESAEADAAPEGTTVEDQEGEPDLPAIDPPKSWSKDAHERWSRLDRETQEFLASRDSEDQKAIKRALNEAADQRKAIEAERKAAEDVRKQYEAKIPALSQALESALQNEFADIKTFDDLRKMQAEDPFRYQQWDLRQKELALVKQEEQAATERQTKEKQSNWMKFVQEESKAFADEVPEFSEKQAEYTQKAAETLRDLGFSDDELGKLANGEEKIAIYDRRLQRLLFDRIKLSEIKAAPAKAIPKPVPAVQRPGVTPPKGQAAAESIQALTSKLNSSGSVEDAYALYQAKQRRNASR
jgi:hypothetical protein